MKFLFKIIPWCFVALFGAELVAVFAPKAEGTFHVRGFGRLPVLMNGRVQPFDSVARNTLLQIRSTGDVPLEEVPSWKFWHHPKKLKSTEWLLEVLFRPETADTRPIFLIHHPELIADLNLGEKGVEKSGLRYYTYNELQPVLREIQEQGTKAAQVDDKLRSAYQKQAVKLSNAVFIYQYMKATVVPPFWNDLRADLAAFEKNLPAGREAVRAREAGKSFDQAALDRFWPTLTQLFSVSRDGNGGRVYPLIIPPWQPGQKREDWTSVSQALVESARSLEVPVPVKAFADLAAGYGRAEPAQFNEAVGKYTEWLQQRFPAEARKGRLEFFFNQTKMFLHAIIIYIFSFLLALGAILTIASVPGFSESLRKSAFYLVVLAGAAHTFGLVFRMYLEARPPVTNLYSSAVFIGWGTMVLGVGLERFYRLGLGSLVASLVGFVTLIIAQNLALGGDTMEMMRAVLDTNFWLATHVVTVTLGYAATFAAGFLGIIYVLLGVFTPLLGFRLRAGGLVSGAADATGKAGAHSSVPEQPAMDGSVQTEVGGALGKMIYGIVCFATLFSFIGTVLGGIWADQSWGRFWGWDPKENGALMIVLWNAVILHVRWGGLARDRGIANLAIFGNIVTSFSWFGVNMLGIGLHSYGFMDAAVKWLMIFVASQLVIIALGLLPVGLWRSFAHDTPSAPPGGGDRRGETAEPAAA